MKREALAVRCACEKFYLYLYGIEFEIRTDHKPLVTVLSAKSKPPSAIIERWLLYLQQFQYILTHIPRKDNAADVLSRLPVGPTEDQDTRELKISHTAWQMQPRQPPYCQSKSIIASKLSNSTRASSQEPSTKQ